MKPHLDILFISSIERAIQLILDEPTRWHPFEEDVRPAKVRHGRSRAPSFATFAPVARGAGRRRLDPLREQFNESSTMLYADYKNARKLIDNRGGGKKAASSAGVTPKP